MTLKGKTALVTGAGRNLGKAIALAYAKEGVNVIVNVRSNIKEAEGVAKQIEGLGAGALAYAADVSDPKAVQAMVDAGIKKFGKIDILVSNAAVRKHNDFVNTSYKDWRELVGIVLDGAFNCSKSVIPHMIKNNFGRIIFIGGEGALAGGANGSPVAAAKNGLIGLMRAISKGHLKCKIRVNMVSPARLGQGWEQETTGKGRGNAPVGRPGHPDDISRACLFLSDEASDYITGEIMHINGGAYTW
jgi:3-oxoacyl-[acyl-carrier protein] reductase